LCEKSEKGRTRSGLILAKGHLMVPLDGVSAISQLIDIQQLDRELDYMRTLGLLDGGLSADEAADATAPPPVDLAPTSLALHMYARCRGARDPLSFYGLTEAAPVRVVATGFLRGGAVIPAGPAEKG